MGDLPHYFDIVLFAMVAGFLILRLRAVLGRRTGHERRPVVGRGDGAGDKPFPLGGRRPLAPVVTTAPPADAVATGLERIRGADTSFDPAHFLEGARVAFDMIVGAFAAGDKTRLRPLLSDDVYTPFAGAIDDRGGAGESLETRIMNLKQVDIVEAGLSGRMARVTVKFVSDQINVLRAHDGSIVDGHPEQPVEKTDFWSFARDIRAADPNWVLVATSSG
ncbi:MAG: Tim44 domain-containing protein [Alphaproteobacteria bacterium]|nr:Tim44 domain-containing protein [Alphaproteobacteria bacterium]